MTNDQKIIAAGDTVARSGDSADRELLHAAQVLFSATYSMQACLRWACTIVIGRGGWDLGDLQRVYASAGRGENWEALRDQLAKARHRG